MIKGEHAYGKTVSKAKLQGQSVSDGIPGEERHAKTLLEEGRRQGREESARLLQIEREENARLLQKEQEKSAQLQKERDLHIQSVRQLLLQVLKLKGLAAEPITRRILEEQDPKLLQLWISFAGDIDSAEELEKMILEKR